MRKALLPALVVLATAGLIHAQDLREEFHQTYALADGGRVIVKNVNGSVHVTGWDRAEVKVDAVKRGRTREALDEARIVVDASANSVEIRTKYPEESRRNSASVEYTISVPRGAVLDSVGTVNGSVRVEGVTGPVKAETVNGNVEAVGATGDLALSSVNGRVQADFERLGTSRVTMKTVNGGIEVGLPQDAGARLNASTVHGAIHSDFDMTIREVKFGPGQSVNTTIGGGGAEMKLTTVNGGINLKRR